MSVLYSEPDPSGLASIIGTLIEQNLRREPARAGLLNGGVVGVVAPDAIVSVTVRMGPGDVTVGAGVSAATQVVVSADSDKLLKMTAAPLRFGLPDALTAKGRAVLFDVFRGRVRIKGLFTHTRLVADFTRLLSALPG
jgi:hypothetical protein